VRVSALVHMLPLVALLSAWVEGCATIGGGRDTSEVSYLPPTNTALVRVAVRKAIEGALPELSLDAQHPVVFESLAQGEHDWLIESEVGQALREDGYSLLVSLPAELGGESEVLTVLSYRPVDLRVIYRDAQGGGWQKGRMIDRQAVARLDIRVATWPKGEIVALREIEGMAFDRVPRSELPLLEGAEFPAENRIGDVESESGRLLEPLVVTGLVALLVYVFYTAESSN
jgi:hypothetical protein